MNIVVGSRLLRFTRGVRRTTDSGSGSRVVVPPMDSGSASRVVVPPGGDLEIREGDVYFVELVLNDGSTVGFHPELNASI